MDEVNAADTRDEPAQRRAKAGIGAAEQLLNFVKADRDLPIPLHEQVAASIRRAIAEGEARQGQRIPHAKDLAAVLGVNSNTVLRAIHLLRDEGLLEAGRGKAITVSGTPEKGALATKLNDLIAFAQSCGYGRPELVRMIEQYPAGTATTPITSVG